MVAARFYMNSWLGQEKYYFEGDNASEILSQFERYQDLGCISRMAKMQGTKKDQKAIRVLDELLDKYYSGELLMDDLECFSLEISIGSFGVEKVAKNDTEVEELRCETGKRK